MNNIEKSSKTILLNKNLLKFFKDISDEGLIIRDEYDIKNIPHKLNKIGYILYIFENVCLQKNISIPISILFKLFDIKKNNRFKKIINIYYSQTHIMNYYNYISQRVFGYVYIIKFIFKLPNKRRNFLHFVENNYSPTDGMFQDCDRICDQFRNDVFGNSMLIKIFNNLLLNLTIRFFIYINKNRNNLKLPIRYIFKEIDIIIETVISAFISFKSKYLKYTISNDIIQKNINDLKTHYKDIENVLDETIIILAFEYMKEIFFNKKKIDQKILKFLNKPIKKT